MDTNEQAPLLERPDWLTAIKADPAAKLGLRKNGATAKARKLDAEQIKAMGLDAPEDHVYDWTMSTGNQDRDGDVIEVGGWEWRDFLATGAGPVLLCHRSHEVPIAKMPMVASSGGALAGTVVFPTLKQAPNNLLAHCCREMVAFEALTMGSVGFLPVEYVYDEDIKGYRFRRQRLLEFSLCAVPSNPDAVRRAKSAGVNVAPLRDWAEQALDMLDGVERKADPLQEIWKATKSPRIWVEGKGGVLVPFERSAKDAPAEQEPAAKTEDEPEDAKGCDEPEDKKLAEKTDLPVTELSKEQVLQILREEKAALADRLHLANVTPHTGQVPA